LKGQFPGGTDRQCEAAETGAARMVAAMIAKLVFIVRVETTEPDCIEQAAITSMGQVCRVHTSCAAERQTKNSDGFEKRTGSPAGRLSGYLCLQGCLEPKDTCAEKQSAGRP